MVTIGSRGSALALAQTGWVRTQILNRFPEAEVTIKIIKTSADRDQKSSIRAGSSVGVFVKELEEALMAKEIDLAVHSMKDLPTKTPDALEIAAIPEREDTRDALIVRGTARSLADLPAGSVVGTGSIRRQSQLLAVRPDLKVVDIRGNVDTRLKKLSDGEYAAIILACAGLNRLGLRDKITCPIEFAEMLPAPGQGALALETRKNDNFVLPLISHLHHLPTAVAVIAERAFLRRMGGGCNTPVAVRAIVERGMLEIEGLVAAPDGSKVLRETVIQDPQKAEQAATVLADKLLAAGGKEILADF